MSESIVGKKSFEFAIHMVSFYRKFSVEKENTFYPNKSYAQELLIFQKKNLKV